MQLIWELELKGTMCAHVTWQAAMVSIWLWIPGLGGKFFLFPNISLSARKQYEQNMNTQ